MKPHLKMLCVDDNADLRQGLKDQFTYEDFDVDLAEDGEVALQMIKKNQYDIILLDVKMPKKDGITVLKEMKENNRLPHVIMLSAVNDVPTAIECVKLGAKDFISKPYEPEELLHVVIKALGSG
ncbi:MAG: response regulator [Bacteroidota bacterium]|nr:response regulator [Bacteroidota bacterium]